ncbi:MULTISPECIES: transporter substrate-binding domain-containing protein [unclassified Caballeronia]|uniref:transporter substrate-binding domain-containing protein n=1 Tax=unclassified Caballeronia TaxID=2646786 RepID=UPI0020279760|nr:MULTISPECIES: transporter substrate-binding domain-containing protein [unclassified Caballeronia]MDR5773681.1 transporter substrate-binding domain-containing protein [Caballeronia sp. LZ002]MDR5805659.1 transporter substrate-binding domain-containing protein [Caballeronia sp. LZ001]MDR5849115.1 transporter substrate-binding domain-containing protein [Caballeronia sp. LZ003]
MALSDPIKVGLLSSTSGATALLERSQWRGAALAMAEINACGGIGGRELVAVHYDPASDPAAFRERAERLIMKDGVNVIFGGYTSTSRKAMLPVVEKHNRLLIYSQQYEGFEYSDNIIYSGASPNQNGVQLADFMTETFGARVYMVGSRYVYPYECNRTMQELLLQHPEGAILGERYLPLDVSREPFAEVIADIKRKSPDWIFCTLIGATVPYLYEAYARAGLDPAVMPIASLNTSETEIHAMERGIAQGHYTAAPYFQSIDTPENHAAVRHHQTRFGADTPTDMNWEAAYYQMHMFAEACARAGSDEIGTIMPHLLGAEYAAPQGRVRIDPVNHHMALYPRIGRANEDGHFSVLRESKIAVAPDPYMTHQTLGDWVTKLSLRDY